MKIKNIAVGGYIQSKKDSKQLIAGHCYQVAEKDVSDKTVRLFSVDDSFDDSLWFCVSDFRKPRPQLKQLDQSVFVGIDEKWRFAAVDKCGEAYVYVSKPKAGAAYFVGGNGPDYFLFGQGYDASNWQNSLIERDIAKELTGSDLARAMLARGDRWILCGNTTDGFASPCIIDGYRCSEDDLGFVLTNGKSIEPQYIHPVNNQGEPLTAEEAGL